ncbi:HNH endonuclease [Mycolicibacterium agri]|uniref:HNH endonuclease n=3 Tax=Mycolicibacterium agri TaxID=36811 RepID=A0A7I9VWF2_MYCAG|nr:HNH endonuclease [Mycolicibacterium agri]
MAGLRAAYEAFAAAEIDSLTRAELVSLIDDLEALVCQMPTQSHRLLARLQAQTTPRQMGAKSWNEVLRIRWRLSSAEASRRLQEAAELGPRTSLTGEPLEPVLPAVAAAQAAGLITGEHVKTLRDAIKDLPGWVDAVTRSQFEVDLVRVAVGAGPKELRETAALRLFLLDQDGPLPDDAERARKRGVSAGRQQRDAMTPLTGQLTPEAWAVWEVIFAKYAAPGMCNPADEAPCTSGTPTQAQIDNDTRSLAQRQHDALLAVGRIALMSGELGQLNGLPVAVIIRTTLQDLESRAGIGITGGGTKIPIADLIRMGAHANHHLAVFDGATGQALALYRSKRIASPAQRIMLIARDGGCTKPCCTVGAYGCQAHHANTDWQHGGNTNVDDMTLACGPDNRFADDAGWTTTINARGECEWHPPPDLDHGQPRINYYHRPEALLRPPEEEPSPTQPAPSESARDAAPTQHDAPADDEAPTEPEAPTADDEAPERSAATEPAAPSESDASAEPEAPAEREKRAPKPPGDGDPTPSTPATSHAPEGPDPPDYQAA